MKNIFTECRTSFGWPGDKLPDNRRGVYTDTPLMMTCLCTYWLSAQISHTCIHTSREQAWLKHNKASQKIVLHPRVMCRPLPHSTLTSSTSSLSPTSPIFQSFSPTQSGSLSHNLFFHCDDPRHVAHIGGPFAKHIEPDLAPEDFVEWAMAEASDDEDDAPMPDAPPESLVIDMPPAPTSARPMSNLERCIALRLVYVAGPR